MNQIDNIMALAWVLCRASEETARMNCDREEDALRAAIEKALAVQPEKRPQNCGTGSVRVLSARIPTIFLTPGK